MGLIEGALTAQEVYLREQEVLTAMIPLLLNIGWQQKRQWPFAPEMVTRLERLEFAADQACAAIGRLIDNGTLLLLPDNRLALPGMPGTEG